MNYWTDYPTDIIDILITLVGFGALLIPVIHMYRKNKEELSIWKVLLITFIGMFTFDYTLQISDERALLPLLPIGVWLIYGGFRINNKEIAWKRYRPFAWIGFISSFLFFFLELLGAFLDGQIYDRDELATYIASVQEPQLVITHPSGEKQTLKEELESLLSSFEREDFDSIAWYKDIEDGKRDDDKQELFPYVLKGTEPQSGSGIQPLIYIERNGKGILISNDKGYQLYFKSETSLFKEGAE